MSALDMGGHIDDDFRSISALRVSKSASYVDGLPVYGAETTSPHTVTIQPLTAREIGQLDTGARRVSDYRKICVNDGMMAEIQTSDDWEFDSNGRGVERYESVSVDNRPWRNYCKIVVALYDK